MFGGEPLEFHVAGIPSQSRRDQCEEDLLNYYYRAVGCTVFAARALGSDSLAMRLYEFSKNFASTTGIDGWENESKRKE